MSNKIFPKHTAILRITVVVCAMFLIASGLFASALASAANEPVKTKSKPAKAAAIPLEKQTRAQALIQPYRFGEPFFKEWRFDHLEQYSGTDIVFALTRGNDAGVLYLWLIKKENPARFDAHSKNFSITFVNENNKSLSADQKGAAKKAASIIRRNDADETDLVKKKADGAGGYSVAITPPGAGRDGATRKSTKISALTYKIVFILIIMIVAIVLAKRVFRLIGAPGRKGGNNK